MSLRLPIDECLSPDLVDLAIAAGHVEPTCYVIAACWELKTRR